MTDDDTGTNGAAPPGKAKGTTTKTPATPPGRSTESPAHLPVVADEAPTPGEDLDVGADDAGPAVAPTDRPIDWSFLTGEAEHHVAVVAMPLEQPDPEPSASAVVFGWLIENQSLSAPMAVASPLLVLLTVLDAAASAGSGLAAPASGLGTFVLLIVLDKTRLATDARLLRRRVDC